MYGSDMNYAGPLGLLVGATSAPPAGIPTFPLPVPTPNGTVPNGCTPGNFYPPSCSPCPPNAPSGLQQALYNMYCAQQQAQYQRASRAAVAAKQPQIALGIRTAAGVTVAAGGIVTLTASPTVPLCITDFEVSRLIAPFFLINSMKTARVDFLADGQGIPADMFAPDAVHPPMEQPYLMPGTQITLTIENIDGAPHPFFAAWTGIPGGLQGPCL